jgi:hypothetical protein
MNLICDGITMGVQKSHPIAGTRGLLQSLIGEFIILPGMLIFWLRSVVGERGKPQPLGRPNPNAVKFFSAVELIALLADREWLDEATKTIGQFWKRKNARRYSLTLEKPAPAA